MQQLASDPAILCPHCGLRLTINKEESKLALMAVNKLLQAQSDFDRQSRLV
jgi:hypothetical protein